MNRKEKSMKSGTAHKVLDGIGVNLLVNKQSDNKRFHFDRVFDVDDGQS